MSITITARCTHSNQVSCLKAVILETVAGGFDPGVWSLVALVTIDAYALWTESASGGQGEMRERTRRGKRQLGRGIKEEVVEALMMRETGKQSCVGVIRWADDCLFEKILNNKWVQRRHGSNQVSEHSTFNKS